MPKYVDDVNGIIMGDRKEEEEVILCLSILHFG